MKTIKIMIMKYIKIKMYKLLFLLFVFSLTGPPAVAQSSTALDTLREIFRSYDSLPYITFDLKYIYTSDTLNGDFQHEVLEGAYTMCGKRARFTIGDIDFMQNDSFFIAVYNTDKYMIVSNRKWSNAGSQVPGRDFIDSLFAGNEFQHYTFNITVDSSQVQRAHLYRKDSLALYDHFYAEFDAESRHFRMLKYDFHENEIIEPTDDDTSTTVTQISRRKTLTIEFSNYRIDNFSDSVYDINNYIWFDHGECVPVEKYKNFKIYYSRSPMKQENP